MNLPSRVVLKFVSEVCILHTLVSSSCGSNKKVAKIDRSKTVKVCNSGWYFLKFVAVYHTYADLSGNLT